MNTLSYPPLYFAVFALQSLAVATVALSRLGTSAGALTLTLACSGAFAVALFCGYSASRKSYVPGNAAQLGQIGIVLVIMVLWMGYAGFRGLWTAFALSLLLSRDLFLTTRRALYFDLAVLLTVFYDSGAARTLPYRWAIAVAFLLGLVFLLMADYTDRRLAQLKIADTREVTRVMPGLRNAAFATALALALAAVIYVLMPQPRPLELGVFPDRGPPGTLSELFGRGSASQGESGSSGGSSVGGLQPVPGAAAGGDTLDLRAVGGVKGKVQAGAKAGEAEAKAGGVPPPLVLLMMRADRPLYLRTHGYVVPTIDAWRETPMRRIETASRALVRKGAPADGVTQRFRILENLDRRIPAAYPVSRIEYPTPAYSVNGDSIVEADEPLAKDTEYLVSSNVRYLGERHSGPGEEKPPATHTWLAPEVLARVRPVALEVTAGRSVTSEKAIALEQYLRANYKPAVFVGRYPLDPTVQFLFETKGGSSRQFAGALAVMLRSIGIPSRIVAGYRARRLNPLHEHYEIWTSDRHHWVEAYIENGWVTFEPTPWAALPADASPETWFEAARDYVRYAREDPVDTLLAGESAPKVAEWYLHAVLVYGWFATFGKLLLLALIAFTAAAWKWQSWSLPFRDALDRWRLRHASQADPVGLVRRCYEAVERMAARRSLARARSENHAEYLERLARERPHLDLPCRTLAAHFGVARYGRDLSSSQAQDALQAARVIADLIDERRVA